MNLDKLAKQLSTGPSALRKMTVDEVRELTGDYTGDAPPFPHRDGTKVFADSSLFRFGGVWAAAGSSNAVVIVKPSDLILLGISRVDIAE